MPAVSLRVPRPLFDIDRAAPAFIALHAALGLAFASINGLGTVHVLGTVAVVLLVVFQARDIARVAQATAYVAACDVLWRMSGASFFWEGPKYLVTATLGFALLRFFRRWRDIGLPATYFATFLPAIVLSALTLGLTVAARGLLSANLSGPLALGVTVLFFSQVRTTPAALRSVLFAMLGPIVSVATVAAVSTVRAGGTIAFRNSSNFVTSGGFGPNQVSALLGLGATICVLLSLLESSRRRMMAELGLAVALASQAALTFSRGGVLNVVVAVIAAAIFVVRHIRSAGRLLAAVAIVGLVLVYAVLPRLESFTGGALGERFSSFDTTNRTRLAAAEVETFRSNPITGIGAGGAHLTRSDQGYRVAAHTEYTRLLAEQGVFGVVAIVTLAAIVLRATLKAQPGVARAMVVAFAAWTFTEMGHSAMRIASIPFVFGLAVAASGLVVARAAPAVAPTVTSSLRR